MIYTFMCRSPKQSYGIILDENHMPLHDNGKKRILRNFVNYRIPPMNPFVAFGFWARLSPSIISFNDLRSFQDFLEGPGVITELWECADGSVWVTRIPDDVGSAKWETGSSGVIISPWPRGDSAHYKRAAQFTIEAVLKRALGPNTKRPVRWFEGFQTKMNHIKFTIFKVKGVKCAYCGLQGKWFNLEMLDAKNWHLNLYGQDEEGEEVLLNIDHIVAKSAGGKTNLDNLQVLCKKCNCTKANQ